MSSILDALPPELIRIIYEYLNLRDSKQFGLTSKKYHNIFTQILPTKTNFRDAGYEYMISVSDEATVIHINGITIQPNIRVNPNNPTIPPETDIVEISMTKTIAWSAGPLDISLSYLFVKDSTSKKFGLYHIIFQNCVMSTTKTGNMHMDTSGAFHSLKTLFYFYFTKKFTKMLRCTGFIFDSEDRDLIYTTARFGDIEPLIEFAKILHAA